MMQQCTRGTKYSISGYVSRWYVQIWCILEVLNFFTIDIGVPLARCQTSKNATWGQVTYCDLVTWPLGSSGRRFFRNVSNCWQNSYGKFGGATRRRFFAICEKPGGVEINPPAGARVNKVKTPKQTCLCTAIFLFNIIYAFGKFT